MKILVTGGSGMIGSNIQKIKKDWIYTNSKNCNLLNYEESYNYIKKQNPTHIIHLAAKVGGLYMNMNNNYEMLYDNLQINMNIIRICKELKIKNFIGCLSTCIFPDKVKYPITEEQLHNGPPHDSNSGYSYGKRMLEPFCREMNKIKGNNYLCIIPTNIYGKYDNFNLLNSHVIPGLIHKCYLAKKNKTVFIIKGTGKSLRQFIYAEDLAKIIINLINYKGKYKNIICTTDIINEISIKELVNKISNIFDYKNIIYDTNYSDGQYRKSVDNKKLKEIIPNLKFTEINKGLEKTIEWFINNYESIRK